MFPPLILVDSEDLEIVFCKWPNRSGYFDDLAEKSVIGFFDKEKCLGLIVILYNIGGGDDPIHKHTTRTGSSMPDYAINLKYDNKTQISALDYD